MTNCHVLNRAVFLTAATALSVLFVSAVSVQAQTQNVTFRYLSDGNVVRAFLPGEFNNWGPNSSGVIASNAASLMTYVDSLEQWIYTTPLQVGQTYQYKVHLHFNDAGSDWQWIPDPLNPLTNSAENDNSVLEVTDPLVMQPAHELNSDGLIAAVSAGLFSSQPVSAITFWVNGVQHDGLPFYDADTGIFRYVLDRPIKAGSQFKVLFTDIVNRSDSLEIGEILTPVTWKLNDFATVADHATLSASITRQDGTVDSTLTEATLYVEQDSQTVSVVYGNMDVEVNLDAGLNTFVLGAEVDGGRFTSDTLRVARNLHPLAAFLMDATVETTGSDFAITIARTEQAFEGMTILAVYDEKNSTAGVDNLFIDTDTGMITGSAAGPGEIYFDVSAYEGNDILTKVDQLGVGLKVEADGTVREMGYAETPAWVNNAVVYEIFPLSFGPEAQGTEINPGNRLQQITSNLPYIAEMGFNTIWFMPIMKNQFMDPLSGGYNITDFYNVDPKLGTNGDFKVLVAEAHELGIKIILDITPNHSSPAHPWVDALKAAGSTSPPGSYIQVEPSAHNRGLDNRGPNLSEIWQVSNGGNLYRKYDGFGDLANLNWDNDDLQAEFLNILAHWVKEYDIDGWRFDVYWGPWRRYGPDRFGRPIRDLMKHLKPDSWILGEIAGTGLGTEVYYADDDNGTSVVGGMDAGYDWNFYFNSIRGTYGNITSYDAQAKNGNFWPGPNARYFRFLENHDEERIAKRLAANPMQILPLTGFLMTTTGVPMVYQGQEVNFGNVGGDERRVSVDWDTELNGTFARYYQQLAQARGQFPAFGGQGLATVNTANNVYAYVRPYLDENAFVMINFAGEPRTVTVNPTAAIELTTDGPITYTHIFADSVFVDAELDGFSATLAPYETAVFIATGGTSVAFDLPDLPALPFGAVYTGVEGGAGDGDYALTLEQNYPNPFFGETVIPFVLPEAGEVQLKAYDLLGREVATLVEGTLSAGAHTVTLEASRLPAGMYFVRLAFAGQIKVQRMVVLK